MTKMINFAHVNQHGNFTAILGHYGLEFTQKGSQIRMQCPFHEDETPSLSITLEETDKAQANTFHCFGCAAKGSPIDFISKHTGNTLRAAAELVADISGCTLAPSKGSAKKRVATKRPLQPRVGTVGKSGGALKKSAANGLDGHSEALEGVNTPLPFTLDLETGNEDVLRRLDLETAEQFGIGLLAETSKSMMQGRICIPIHNENGELVAYTGRWRSEAVPEGETKYLFPPRFNKLRELYNLHRLGKARHIVIVEGFFSAIRLHQLGVPVVALMGTAISAEQIDRLHHAGVKSALVLLDGDDAGRKASEVVGLTLMRRLFTRIVHLPDGCSPDNADTAALQAMLPFPLRNQF